MSKDITIKLKEIGGKGRIKYHHVLEGYQVEIGETITFKWFKPWKVIDIFTTKSKEAKE